MRAVTFVALLAFVAIAGAETLNSARLRGQHHYYEISDSTFIALKKTSFGENLFSMLNLKFKATGRLDKIVDLLENLDKDINGTQAKETIEYDNQVKVHEKNIRNAQNNIKTAEHRIKALKTERTIKKQDRDQAIKQKNALINERTNIEDFMAKAKIQREKEAQAFKDRVDAQDAMISGIKAVEKILTVDLPKDNTIDPKDLKEVLSALNDLKSTLEDSIKSDTAAEHKAIRIYDKFVVDQDANLKKIAAEIKKVTAEITLLNERLEAIEKEIAVQQEKIEKNKAIITDEEKALADLKARYESNYKVRKEQRSLIQAVKAKLLNNPKDVQKFLASAI